MEPLPKIKHIRPGQVYVRHYPPMHWYVLQYGVNAIYLKVIRKRGPYWEFKFLIDNNGNTKYYFKNDIYTVTADDIRAGTYSLMHDNSDIFLRTFKILFQEKLEPKPYPDTEPEDWRFLVKEVFKLLVVFLKDSFLNFFKKSKQVICRLLHF